MNKHTNLYIAFLLLTNFCFSQNEIFYKQIFENKENFKVLKILGGEIPKKFKIIDTTVTFHSKSFWLDRIDLKEERQIKEIEMNEHHPFNNVYIFSKKKLDSLFVDEEKKYLSNACQKFKSKKIKINEKKYFTIENTDKIEGFYFLISEPVYSSDNKYAFIEVDIKSKYTMYGEKIDDYYAVLKVIFQKDANENWKQIDMDEHLVF